jgi:alcohol dehydrogenase class IV
MLLGSMYAGMAFCNAPVGAIHALAYPLACHHGMSHGESNSMIMARVMEFNAPVATKEYAEIAPYMFEDLKEESCNNEEMTNKLISKVKQLVPDLGIKTRLSQVGIKLNDIDFLAGEGIKQQRLLPNNIRHVTLEDTKEIYRSIL